MTLWLAKMIKRMSGELVGSNIWELGEVLATTNTPVWPYRKPFRTVRRHLAPGSPSRRNFCIHQ